MIFVSGFYDLSRHEPRPTPAVEWRKRAEWLLAQRVSLHLVTGKPEATEPASASHAVGVVEPRFDQGEILLVRALLSRSPIAYTPTKDTAHYLCLMRERYSWMRRVAEMHPDETLTWVDFGLPHEPSDSLAAVSRRPPAPGRIRIAALSYVPKMAREDLDVYYARHWWPVGAGLWSARRPEIEWIEAKISEEWERCLSLGHAPTDEMMLGRILLRYPEKFDVFYADHTSLAANWCHVTRSHRLVAEMGLRALEDGDHQEAEARFKALLFGASMSALLQQPMEAAIAGCI